MTNARAIAGRRHESQPKSPPRAHHSDPGTASRDAEILALQRLAGNAAVSGVVQRDDKEPDIHHGRRAKGADVRAALQAKLPGLLAALTKEQVDQWQEYVDWRADQSIANKEYQALEASIAYYDDRSIGRQLPSYQRGLARIQRNAQKKPSASGTTVDPNLLVADDIMTPPAWDRDKELEFRQWAVAELTKQPFHITFSDPDEDQFNVRAMEGLASFNNCVVTVQALQQYFRKEYEQQVTNRPLWKELAQALIDMDGAAQDAKFIHADWLEKNKHTNWFIVWTAETLGEGSTDLPEENAFVESDAMRAKCWELLHAHKLELFAPYVEATAQKVYKVIADVEAYDKRVTSGAQTAIKWAERFKTAGSIAAGIASGGLGLTGSALVAGGYSFAQGAAEQMSAVSHGIQDKVDWSGLATQAGVTTLLAVAGGALQKRFADAWEPRLASFGPTLGKRMAGVAAAGTSQFYLTGAELAIGHFIQGHPLPESVDDLADLIITKSLEGAGMDIATHAAGERAASEYQAWKAKRAGEVAAEPGTARTMEKPTVTEAAKIGGPKVAVEPTGAAKAGGNGAAKPGPEVSPADMPDSAVKSLLRTGGGWERLHAELQAGTGLGHGLSVRERQQLIARFDAHRQSLAREVAKVFDGDVRAGAGGALEVRLSAKGGADQLAKARQYLDQLHPGWANDTGLTVEPPASRIEDPNAVKAQKALERELSPEVKALGMAMGSRYTDLPVAQRARLDTLVAIVNNGVQASGAPAIRIEATGNGPHFNAASWTIEVPTSFATKSHLTPHEFAEICNTIAHEARHARQMFEALRVASDTEAARMLGQFRPDVAQRARALGTAGDAHARALDPASLDYADARSYYESMWGAGYANRQSLLQPGGRLDQARAAKWEAMAKERDAMAKLARFSHLPERALERRVAQRRVNDAKAAREAADAEAAARYDEYRNLAEEIDAWAHGDAVQAATLHYVELRASLERAQVAEVTASARLENARQAFMNDPNSGQAELNNYVQALTSLRAAAADTDRRARALAAIAQQRRRR